MSIPNEGPPAQAAIDLRKQWLEEIQSNRGDEPVTTPTLTEAVDRLADAIPAKPEWAGSVAVDSRDLEAVTDHLRGLCGGSCGCLEPAPRVL